MEPQFTFEMVDGDKIREEWKHIFNFEHITRRFLQNGHGRLHIRETVHTFLAFNYVTCDSEP